MSRRRRTPDSGVFLARFVGDPHDPRGEDVQGRKAVVACGMEISCIGMTEVPESVFHALSGHSHFVVKKESGNGR